MGFLKSLTKVFKPVVQIGTFGTVDISKKRFSIPGSSSHLRGLASGYTLGLADKQINTRAGKSIANLASTAVYGTAGFIVGGPIGAGIGGGLSTQMWSNPPKFGTSLGITAAAAGVPALGSLFQTSPGSGYTQASGGYGPYPVAVPVPASYQDPVPQATQAQQDVTPLLLVGGGIVLAIAIALTKR